MELLTHGGEHHEIGDAEMVDDDDGDESPSPDPRTDSILSLPRGFRAWRWLRIVKRDESFFFYFFLPERKYIELESRSEEFQGAHEVGGRAHGGRRAPTLVARVWAPWSSSFARIFYYFQKDVL